MKGWRSRHHASYNVKVHTTVVPYSIKVRRGYVCVCTAVNTSLWTTFRINHVMDSNYHVILGLFQGSVDWILSHSLVYLKWWIKSIWSFFADIDVIAWNTSLFIKITYSEVIFMKRKSLHALKRIRCNCTPLSLCNMCKFINMQKSPPPLSYHLSPA